MKAYLYHPEEGYFVGECLGLLFFESSIASGTLSPEEQPIEFECVQDAIDYVRSLIASDGKAFVTTDPPPGPPTTVVYRLPVIELPEELKG